jgi:biotin transporter BioY
VLPFVPGDLVKSALAALALPGAWRLIARGHSERR